MVRLTNSHFSFSLCFHGVRLTQPHGKNEQIRVSFNFLSTRFLCSRKMDAELTVFPLWLAETPTEIKRKRNYCKAVSRHLRSRKPFSSVVQLQFHLTSDLPFSSPILPPYQYSFYPHHNFSTVFIVLSTS